MLTNSQKILAMSTMAKVRLWDKLIKVPNMQDSQFDIVVDEVYQADRLGEVVVSSRSREIYHDTPGY